MLPAGVVDRIANLSRAELEVVVETEESAVAWHESIIRSLLGYLHLVDEVAAQVEWGFADRDQVVVDRLGLRHALPALSGAALTPEEISEARRIYDEVTGTADSD